MAQDFCSLEQAAQMLNMSPQDLNAMAQRREVRAFSDRGTWRFRVQDIQELARRMGVSSSIEVPSLAPKSGKMSKSGRMAKPPAGELPPVPLTPEME
ncbi:MAG TPA: helix-turn-helix domain-containing protein, partial [Gemmatales bacterium]|nr:helix-turn-helix domain-containing protein [Gemmatales bacterium]